VKITAGSQPGTGYAWIAAQLKTNTNKIYHLEKEDMEAG